MVLLIHQGCIPWPRPMAGRWESCWRCGDGSLGWREWRYSAMGTPEISSEWGHRRLPEPFRLHKPTIHWFNPIKKYIYIYFILILYHHLLNPKLCWLNHPFFTINDGNSPENRLQTTIYIYIYIYLYIHISYILYLWSPPETYLFDIFIRWLGQKTQRVVSIMLILILPCVDVDSSFLVLKGILHSQGMHSECILPQI